MATIAGLSLRSGPSAPVVTSDSREPLSIKSPCLSFPWKRSFGSSGLRTKSVVRAAPERIGEQVAESIKHAEEACSGDATSGECAAAWDEVEELSAAASHARDRQKDSDPLETFCKDNPASEECRTYDD